MDEGPEIEVYPLLNSFYPSWHAQAACLDSPVEEFFGPSEENRSMSPGQIKQAQKVCDQCPVFEQCLRQAIVGCEEYGVWAGTSGRIRRTIQEMILHGIVTAEQVIEDYINGERDRYESRDSRRRIQVELARRKARVRAAQEG